MKILHVSDTHLGLAEHNAIDPQTGLNVREQDFYRAFRRVVDAACETKPDLVIHAGDLFDAVRPSNRALTEAIEGFRRILDAGVPLVVIAGNHETPRLRATGSIFKALQAALPRAHVAYDGVYRAVELAGAVVHAVPDAASEEELERALGRAKAARGALNVLVLHAGVRRAAAAVQSGEYNQHYVALDALTAFADFDYIALGHYHRHMRVDGTDNAYYSGPTERTGIDEASAVPGYVEVELPARRVRHVPIDCRPMRDVAPIPCDGLPADAVVAKLRAALEGQIAGAIVRVVLERIAPPVAAALPESELARLRAPALHCEIVFDVDLPGRRVGGAPLAFGSLPVEFDRFLAAYEPDGAFDRASVRALGLDYLGRAIQRAGPGEGGDVPNRPGGT
jgi:predicted phosphodiesterase